MSEPRFYVIDQSKGYDQVIEKAYETRKLAEDRKKHIIYKERMLNPWWRNAPETEKCMIRLLKSRIIIVETTADKLHF